MLIFLDRRSRQLLPLIVFVDQLPREKQESLDIDIQFEIFSETNVFLNMEYEKIPYINWKHSVARKFHDYDIISIQGGPVTHVSFTASDTDMSVYNLSNADGRFVRTLRTQTYMRFKLKRKRQLPTISGNLSQAFNVNLTLKGRRQYQILEDTFREVSNIYKQFGQVYAQFISIVQSSGSGKSKICDEMLLKHPGVSLVFRDSVSDSFPLQAGWVKEFLSLVRKDFN